MTEIPHINCQGIKLDGTQFGSRVAGNAQEVIIGVESKKWIDEQGSKKSKAGFAQVMIGQENKENVKKFISKNINKSSTLLVDGATSYKLNYSDVRIEAKLSLRDKEFLSNWHPWMRRFVSNARVWILGTNHGINPKTKDNCPD